MDLELLLKIAIFEGLTFDELISFLKEASYSVRYYKQNDFVTMQGEPCRSVFLLYKGKVRSGMINSEGKEVVIEDIEAPRLLAPAFIYASDNHFPVNVIALQNCEMCVINKSHFLKLMQNNAVVLSNFLRIISDRSVFLSQKVNAFALQNLKSRLSNYLLNLQSQETQQQIADKLGVARPSVARILADLIEEGSVKIDKRTILVVDRKKLQGYI